MIHLKRANNIIDLKTCQEEFRKTYLAELLQAEATAYGNQGAEMMKFLGQKATKFELDAWRQSEEQKAAYVKCMKGLTDRVNAGSFQLTKFDCINPSDEHRIGRVEVRQVHRIRLSELRSSTNSPSGSEDRPDADSTAQP